MFTTKYKPHPILDKSVNLFTAFVDRRDEETGEDPFALLRALIQEFIEGGKEELGLQNSPLTDEDIKIVQAQYISHAFVRDAELLGRYYEAFDTPCMSLLPEMTPEQKAAATFNRLWGDAKPTLQ